jgi:hypothetical protein
MSSIHIKLRMALLDILRQLLIILQRVLEELLKEIVENHSGEYDRLSE